MAGLIPLPQTIHHHTTRLTHREAHTLLSTFLQTAETNPAYRPDSTLSSHGVISSSTSANQNLTLNHLGRILKGIAGEQVGGPSDFDEFFGYRDPRRKRKQEDVDAATEQIEPGEAQGREGQQGKRQRVHGDADANVEDAGGKLDAVALEGEGDGELDDWQDKEDYEHAQIEGTREILLDDEDPTRMVEDGTNEVALEDVEVDVEHAGHSSGRQQSKGQKPGRIDKNARKLAKKEKRKEEKRAKHQAQ